VAERVARRTREKGWLAIVLALSGGGVDAVGYLVLADLFTAHMSGNSITMSVHAGQGKWPEAFHRFFPIPLFVLGVALGAAVSEALARRGVRRTFAAAMTLEVLLLVAFLLAARPILHDGAVPLEPAWRFYLLAALPALAMGIQNASLRRVGGRNVRTTYISGLLTNFAEETVQYGYALYDRARGVGFPRSPRKPSPARMALNLGMWLAYAFGAVVGTWATLSGQLFALLVPIGCLILVAIADVVHPIAPPRVPARPAQWNA
jgi:uncharacterized membrane protein YoaK (UPF0700 family)